MNRLNDWELEESLMRHYDATDPAKDRSTPCSNLVCPKLRLISPIFYLYFGPNILKAPNAQSQTCETEQPCDRGFAPVFHQRAT